MRVPANSSKRRASSVPGDDKMPKRVRFAGQVEIGGLDGLKQQLERWSKECVVCYFISGEEAGWSRSHGGQGTESRDGSTHANGGGAGGLRGVRGAADDMPAVAVGSAVGGERGSVPVRGRLDFDDDGDGDVGPGGWQGAGWRVVTAGRGRPVGGRGGGEPVV